MEKVLVIAEAGVNHNGSLEIAKKLVIAAKECGADVIKFQTAKVEQLVSKFAPMAEYQKKSIGKEMTQRQMLEQLMMSYDEFMELSIHCNKVGIRFLSTPFDIESIHFLNDIVPFWKVPSGEITNFPYLVEIAQTKKPVILSSGMCELHEIEEAISVLKQFGTSDIRILHCNTQYPTPYKDVNLRTMNTLQKHFCVPVGYSDHTKGIEVAIAAVAMGAAIIEKHITLDKNLSGPDHQASIEPSELKAMISSIRNIEQALGSSVKKVTKSEYPNRVIARKSIVAAATIKQGEVFTESNLTTKRPGQGISPMKWREVIGKKAIRDFAEDEMIEI